MRLLALLIAFAVAAPASADDYPRMRCASCSLLPAGATGSDLTLSGQLTMTTTSALAITFTDPNGIQRVGWTSGSVYLGYSVGTGRFQFANAGLDVAGTVNVSTGNLIARNAGFTQFSVGPAGNAYLTTDSTGLTTGIMGTVNQGVNFNGSMTTNATTANSGADTTEDNLQTYAVPASAISVNARGIRYTAWGAGVSTADVTTVRCYFGATVCATKVLTASQANTWRMQFEVLRTGATTQICTGQIVNGGTASSTTQTNASPGETLSNAITVKCTGQRATSSVANSVQQFGGILESIN